MKKMVLVITIGFIACGLNFGADKAKSQVSGISSTIEINGLEVKLNDLPKGLVLPDGLGL